MKPVSQALPRNSASPFFAPQSAVFAWIFGMHAYCLTRTSLSSFPISHSQRKRSRRLLAHRGIVKSDPVATMQRLLVPKARGARARTNGQAGKAKEDLRMTTTALAPNARGARVAEEEVLARAKAGRENAVDLTSATSKMTRRGDGRTRARHGDRPTQRDW